jgi:hypothetical protein
MARFVYNGEAPNGFIELYGVKFVPGEASEVSDADLLAIRKLSGHSLFERADVVAPMAPEPAVKKSKKPKSEPDHGDLPEVQ